MDGEPSLGRWVKQRRQALALTQRELAQRVGCALSTIQKIEINERQPSQQIAELLAHHLTLAPDERDAFLHLASRRPALVPLTLPVVLPAQRRFNNLPHSLTSLIGREWEVTTLCARLLEDNVRLLTITGPPGIGKTRLSLEVATQLSDSFPDTVCFVALAPIAGARFVPAAIGRALGIEDTGGQPLLERIKAHLRSQSALLVLDNFEHLLPAAPLVIELLEAASHLKILVTSRATLQLYGEHEFVVPPLALPDLKWLLAPDQLQKYAAVDLFVQRARAVQQEFTLSETNAHTVAEICVRLEGLPLAVELAAARSKLFPPQALLTHLIGAFAPQLDLLAGPRHLPSRHRSLRSAIAWSYDLLNPTEQAVFRCLGVFAGGCTLEAAQAVIWDHFAVSREPSASCRGDNSLIPGPWLLQTLQSLVNQSLVIQQPEPDGEPRFTLLEMLGEYALEQLQQHGEAEAARRAHVTYFVQLAERCAVVSRGLTTAEAHTHIELEVAARPHIDREWDNLRTALHWVAEHDLEQELRLIVAMTEFWNLRRYLGEARQWIEERLPHLAAAAPQLPPQPMAHYATIVGMRAFFTWLQGDLALAQTRFEESIVLWRQLHDQTQLGMALQFLSATFYSRGLYAAARAPAQESVAILRELDEPWPLGCVLYNLGAVTAATGDYATAHMLYEECLAVFRSIGHAWGISMGLMGLSEICFAQGDDVAARRCLVDALQSFRRLDEPWHVAATLLSLGKVAWRAGERAETTACWDESVLLARELGAKRWLAEALYISGLAAQASDELPRAKAFFRESLGLYQTMENTIGVAYGLSGLAGMIEPPAQRARLLGVAATVLDTARLPMDQIERAHYEATVAAVHAQLGEAAFAAAWAEGQAMSLVQAVAYALAQSCAAASP